MFVPAPHNNQHLTWSKRVRKAHRHVKTHREYLLAFEFSGTLCSGDPYTTLTNTFRSILYSKFYLRNIPSHRYAIFAAGDDVTIFFNEPDLDIIKTAIRNNTSQDHLQASSLG